MAIVYYKWHCKIGYWQFEFIFLKMHQPGWNLYYPWTPCLTRFLVRTFLREADYDFTKKLLKTKIIQVLLLKYIKLVKLGFHFQRKKKTSASSGNRTRAARVAGEHSTTEPTMLTVNDFQNLRFYNWYK